MMDEFWGVVIALGALVACVAHCMSTRFVYLLAQDLSDNCDKLYEAIERIEKSEPLAQDGHATADAGLSPEANGEQ